MHWFWISSSGRMGSADEMPGGSSLNKNPHHFSLSGQTITPRGIALCQPEYFWPYLPWPPGLYWEKHLFRPCCAAQSCFSRVQLFVTPWTAARQAPLSTGFSRQEHREWVAISSSRGSSRPREGSHISYVSCIGGWVLYHWQHLGSPADKRNVLSLFSFPSRWKVGTERKTAGRGEGREKSEVRFFWWEMSVHGEPGGANHKEGDIGRLFRHCFSALKISFLFYFF